MDFPPLYAVLVAIEHGRSKVGSEQSNVDLCVDDPVSVHHCVLPSEYEYGKYADIGWLMIGLIVGLIVGAMFSGKNVTQAVVFMGPVSNCQGASAKAIIAGFPAGLVFVVFVGFLVLYQNCGNACAQTTSTGKLNVVAPV